MTLLLSLMINSNVYHDTLNLSNLKLWSFEYNTGVEVTVDSFDPAV